MIPDLMSDHEESLRARKVVPIDPGASAGLGPEWAGATEKRAPQPPGLQGSLGIRKSPSPVMPSAPRKAWA